MPLYVYCCPEGHETELLRPRTIEIVACACGKAASRAEVNRIGVTGFAPVPRDQRNFRQSYREFTEARSEVGYAYDRARSEGMPVREPDYVGAAMQQARAKGAAV